MYANEVFVRSKGKKRYCINVSQWQFDLPSSRQSYSNTAKKKKKLMKHMKLIDKDKNKVHFRYRYISVTFMTVKYSVRQFSVFHSSILIFFIYFFVNRSVISNVVYCVHIFMNDNNFGWDQYFQMHFFFHGLKKLISRVIFLICERFESRSGCLFGINIHFTLDNSIITHFCVR